MEKKYMRTFLENDPLDEDVSVLDDDVIVDEENFPTVENDDAKEIDD